MSGEDRLIEEIESHRQYSVKLLRPPLYYAPLSNKSSPLKWLK